MSAAPFSSELKVILALTALFIGWVFAAMVPKNNPSDALESGTTLGGVLAPTGEVPCLDGNGTFGFLPQRADSDTFLAQTASILLGRRLDAVTDSGAAAIALSGPGAKTDAFASTLYIPKNTPLTGSPSQYRDFWSSRTPAGAGTLPNAESTVQNTESTDENSEQAVKSDSSDALLAAVAPNSSTDSGQNSPEKAVFDQNAAAEPVTTDTTEPIAGFTQEDLLDDRQKGPTALRWKKELEVTEIEGPEFSADAMPVWNDDLALAGLQPENAADDPLALEAQKAQNEGLLADATKVARPVNQDANTPSQTAQDAIRPVEHHQALGAPASEGITTANAVLYHPNSDPSEPANPSPRTGTLVVRKKPAVRTLPAPTPVTIYTATGDETASDLIEKFQISVEQRTYFQELNKGTLDGPIAAGSEILIPQSR